VATKAQIFRLFGGGGTPPPTPGPAVLTPPEITGETVQVGILLTATPPTYTPPDAVLSGPVWRYESGDTISGASGSSYTPVVGDIGEDIFVRYTLTSGGITINADSAAVGPVIAAVANAPIVANQTLDFGRLTLAGAGGIAPTNTGGTITTGCAINSGTNANHWQINASTGVITPSAIGVSAGLSASYSLGCTFANGSGSDTATITINTEANAYDVATAAEATSAFSTAGAVSVDTCVWFRAGIYTPLASWFNSRAHTGTMTIKSRVPWYSGEPAIFDTTGPVEGTAWKNLKFKDFKWNCRFLRATMANTSYIITIRDGTWGKVVFEDNDIAGDLDALGPGQHFKGFVGISNTSGVNLTTTDIQINGTEPLSSGNQLKSRLHGMWRMINPAVGIYNTGPGLRFNITGTDIYDMGLDGLYIGGNWTNIDISGNYIHNPYIDKFRVAFDDAADDVFIRSTAWTGAANGKKLFMVWAGQFVSTAGSADCLYAQGTTADPRLKLSRNNAGNIVCTVADAAGANAVTLTSAFAYTGGSFKLVVAVSIDTDSHARMSIWKEQNGGGGSWVESVTDTVAGETLNLNSGPVSLAGTETKTEKFEGYYTRMFVWYGQSPDLTSTTVQNNIVNSTLGRDVPVATLTALYGTPVLWQEGITSYWQGGLTPGVPLGTGGTWTDLGLVEIDHGDLIQTASGATVTGWNFSDNILSSGFDNSAEYARPNDPLGLYDYYYEMQGIFMEDIKSNNYMTAATIDRNIILCASAHGISPYNAKDSFVRDNILIMPSEWGYPTNNYPRLRVFADGTAPLIGGNTVTNNWTYAVTTSGTGNITTPANVGASVSNVNYSTYMTNGAEPRTRAEIVAFVNGAN
jgi:hypothetical protein